MESWLVAVDLVEYLEAVDRSLAGCFSTLFISYLA